MFATARRERSQVLQHRLNEATRRAEEQRRSARLTMTLLATTYGILFLLTTFLAIWGNTEQQRWALGALTAVQSSLLGFLVGRRS